jgi:hypothetical protein
VTCDRLERDGLLGQLGEQMDPHVTQCDDCRARRDEYAQLAAMLAQESPRPLPNQWKERTLARWKRELARRRRRTATIACCGAAAAAVVILLAVWPRVRPRPELTVSLEKGEGAWRGTGHPGDRLVARATAGSSPHLEVRIYRHARELLLRCPGESAPICRSTGDTLDVRWNVPSVGDYQVVLLWSSSVLPPPTGDLGADLRAAARAGAHAQVDDSTSIN